MKHAALIITIAVALLLNGCHRHSRSGESWPSGTGTYQKTPDGFYRVRPGDTLYAISFDYGLDWRDIARWNGISPPYVIYPDQQLRMSAPAGAAPRGSSSGDSSAVTTSPARPAPSSSTATTTGLNTPRATTSPAPAPSGSATTSRPPATPPPASPASSGGGADPSSWRWPTQGTIVSNFKANDPSRNGIEIAGQEGQPIVSSAAGEVVYSGNGLIGYGELIIIKHSDRLLSAYAHNRKRLVSEGDSVPAGAKIAEMGRDDRNKAILHFEIRVNGEPGNPLKYLPRR